LLASLASLRSLAGAVFSRLLSPPDDGNADSPPARALRAACVKFTETAVLCFSPRATSKSSGTADFALEDVPTGHPTIARDALAAIGRDAFECLQGWVSRGGQVKVEAGVGLREDGVGLGPAVLSAQALEADDVKDEDVAFEWRLDQKAYAIAVNALAITGSTRIGTFSEVSRTLAKLVARPPPESPSLSKAGALSTKSAISASALKLLRNPLSVASDTAADLMSALSGAGIGAQAEKAFKVAEQQQKLLKMSKKDRRRANEAYTWEATETVSSKRKQQAEDALAKVNRNPSPSLFFFRALTHPRPQIRASKMARGLGNGVQFPHSMTDMVELIMLNLEHVEDKNVPAVAGGKDLTFLLEAIQSGGRTLMEDESRWYENSGGVSWLVSDDEENEEMSFMLEEKAVESSKELFAEQVRCEPPRSMILREPPSPRFNVPARAHSYPRFNVLREPPSLRFNVPA
jgi:hypothetical protein